MRFGITPKAMAGWFVVVIVLYFCVFYGTEYWRHRKGPWEVSFVTDEAGIPSVVIYQPKLNISSVEILFPGERVSKTNLSQRVLFERPLNKAGFGRVLYEDLTFLPGVVTFDLFGHEVELLPRTMIIDKKEVPWKSEAVIEMSVTNKLPQPLKPAHTDENRR